MLSGKRGSVTNPLLFHRIRHFFGPKVRRAHLVCFGVLDPPSSLAKNLIFLDILKFVNFQKRWLLGPQGVFEFEPAKMILYMIIYLFRGLEAKTCHFSKILTSEKCNFLTLIGWDFWMLLECWGEAESS